MLCIIYLYQGYFPHYHLNGTHYNVHLPDTYTAVTVQVVLDRRPLEKQWDVDQVFW